MDVLTDVLVTCPVCEGHHYNRETLQVKFKGTSIDAVLEMDVQQFLELFENIPKVLHKLQTLHDVGLDYIKLGQPSPTLSGGEAQRIKLARELVKKSTGQTLYLLDEPTTGLHFADIKLLLKVLNNFADAGNTVLVVEHNLDVIKTADWIIDLGLEGGEGGGRIVATGTPEDVMKVEDSYTGQALASVLRNGYGSRPKPTRGPRAATKNGRAKLAKQISVRGAQQHNLKSVDAKIARDKMTVFCGPSGSGVGVTRRLRSLFSTRRSPRPNRRCLTACAPPCDNPGSRLRTHRPPATRFEPVICSSRRWRFGRWPGVSTSR